MPMADVKVSGSGAAGGTARSGDAYGTQGPFSNESTMIVGGGESMSKGGISWQIVAVIAVLAGLAGLWLWKKRGG